MKLDVHWLGWMIGSAQWLAHLVSRCPHPVPCPTEGKHICPRCGHGVIARWVVIRCQGCAAKRPARYHMRQVVPTEAFCHQCGSAATTLHYLESPQYVQLNLALVVLEEESHFLAQQPRPPVMAWLAPDRPGSRHRFAAPVPV